MFPLYKMKCQSKDRNSKPCRNFAIVNYCKNHSYMEEYTDEMKANVKLCSTCKLWCFMGEYNTCEGCRLRGSAVRDKVKETIVLCVKEGCKYKQSDNKYCGKHQADYFLEQTKEAGLKQCYNYLRGCRTQNDPSYTFSKCKICLEKDRLKDKEKRKDVVVTDEGRKCNTCFKFYPFIHFKGIHGDTLTCSICRDSNKRADEKRDKEHVQELARTNTKKPERIAVKKAWKERNHDKCSSYWIESRARLIENDIEGYLKKNAEQSKKWREANPDKVKITNQTKINSIHCQYGVYQTSAISKRLEFTITKEEFMDRVKHPCYYCGIIQDKGFNGIDRLDSAQDYIIENCVSCCEMCNMMKGSLGPTIFVHRVEHILTHLKLFEGNLYPDEFANVITVSYHDYKKRAKRKELPFEISEEAFTIKCNMSCYLCAKKTDDTHKNGIDRVDNKKGYTEENTKSCCWNCNFMKKNYDYELFINKLKLIYENQKVCPIHENNNKELHNIVPGNKLTKQEQKERYETNKKKQKEILHENIQIKKHEKYGYRTL